MSILKLSNCRIKLVHYSSKDEIHIQIEDELSGIEILDAQMTREALADILTNREAACSVELNQSELIGRMRQVKTENVPLDNARFPVELPSAQARILKPFEVDGWIARRRDLENWHNYNSLAKTVSVVFKRWVELEK